MRHWKAATVYAKSKDILEVKRILGHRRLDSTMVYTHLVNFKVDEYHIRVASTLEEALELAKVGFEKWDEFPDGRRIYRKRK